MGATSQVARYTLENPDAIVEVLSLMTERLSRLKEPARRPIYLAGGWPQDAPPQVLRDALKELAEDEAEFASSARYGPSRGQPEFLEALIHYEEVVWGRSGVDVGELIVGMGSTELTSAFMLACMDPGSELIVTRPGYLNYARQAEVEGLLQVRVKWWTTVKNHEFNPDLEELKELVTDRTRLIILCSPGNPDGQVLDGETLDGVVDIAQERGVWVLVDVPYRAFCFGEPPRYYSRERRENEVWMCTLSKELRIPGWRIAYAIADEKLVDAVDAIQQARTICPSTLTQKILLKVLTNDERLRELKEFYEEGRRKYARAALEACRCLEEGLPEVHVLRPMGGFFTFFDASAYDRDSRRLCRRLVREALVALTPGAAFGMEGWIRLAHSAVVEKPELLREAVKRVREVLYGRC